MEIEAVNTLLVRKYNQSLPRYTSYPAIPVWKDIINVEQWKQVFMHKFANENHTNGISIYIHLPFCESLCTHCSSNKTITTNHKVEDEYLAAIQKEWSLYRKLMKQTPVIRELHLGGGTPTFFSPKNLQKLISFILDKSIIHPRHEFSIAGHPGNSTSEHLKMLYNLGFRRICYQVQDNDAGVQRIINRIQPFAYVKAATENARAAGFTSVNFKLVYGLPLQTSESLSQTITQVLTLRPDQVTFHSYEHVPGANKTQKLLDESHLPKPEEKIQMYVRGKDILMKEGYVEIGMDYFALPTDELYKAWKAGKLHRNFMGYTTQHSAMLLGLGVSSVSDTGNAFVQNEKNLHDYYASIREGKPAVKKGYFLTDEDISFRAYIRDISCKGHTLFQEKDLPVLEKYCFPRLEELSKDGLLSWNKKELKLTSQGRYFIRNICSAFDLYLHRAGAEKNVFSKAI